MSDIFFLLLHTVIADIEQYPLIKRLISN